MTVGNISTYADVNSILAAGRADLCVAGARPPVRSLLTRHAAAEQGVALPWPEQYSPMKRYKPRPR